MRILLTGDSITDSSRDRSDPSGLGLGYVARVATHLPDAEILNTGISGNRISDLRDRWERDVMAHQPDVLSIMIGINDTWHSFRDKDTVSSSEFETDYRALLDAAQRAGIARIMMMEPFLVPVEATQWEWRVDLDAKIAVVRRLAHEYDADLVATDGPLAQVASRLGPRMLVHDGVHPTSAGHALLAEWWLEVFDPVHSSSGSARH